MAVTPEQVKTDHSYKDRKGIVWTVLDIYKGKREKMVRFQSVEGIGRWKMREFCKHVIEEVSHD